MKKFFNILFIIALALLFVYTGHVTSSAGDINIDAQRDRIHRIAADVAGAANIDVNIVVTPEFAIDACVYPDGTIVITSGLVEISRSDDEIAFVIGHEISHFIVRDFINKSTPAIIDTDELPEHLTRELNADLRGMYYAEKAGYNPYASVKILTRIATDFDYFFEKRIEAISHYLKNSNRLSSFGAE